MSLADERRAARERALSLLYEAETKGVDGATVLSELPLPADELTEVLVRAVDERRAEVDALLERFAQGWTVARMAALDRAALRMGTAELLTRPEVPTGVILAETVDLASRFGTDGSGRFVNGLLARVAREVRPDAPPSDPPLPAPPAGDEGELQPTVGALVIDLDGVIRHWDTDYYPQVEAALGLPEGALVRVALDPERLARATDGRLRFEEWCEEIGAVLHAEHGIDPEAAAQAWADSQWRIDLDVVELVEAVRERVPVVLLSNASTRLVHDLDRSGILEVFDAVVSSADIRAAKPDRRAYAVAAEAAGVPLERCLFVDDLPANIDGALAAGMDAALFTGVDDLRAALRERQLLR